VTKRWLSWILRRHIQSSSGQVETEAANRFADTAILAARELVISEGLDPLTLPRDQTIFEETFLFLRLSASVVFDSSYLKGLATLERQGDAQLELDGDWLTLQTALVANQLEFGSQCSAKFLDIGPTYELSALVDSVTLKLKARINITTMQVICCVCEIAHIGEVTISESGEVFRVEPDMAGTTGAEEEDPPPPYPLNSLLDVISELFLTRCKDALLVGLEQEAARRIHTALSQADLTKIASSYGRSYFRNVSNEPEPRLPLP